MTEAQAKNAQAPILRPHQGVAKADYRDRGRVMELNRYPENFFAKSEQAGVLGRQHRSRHRLLADKMLQGRLFLLWRHPALPARVNFNHIPVNAPPNAHFRATIATARCAPTAISAER